MSTQYQVKYQLSAEPVGRPHRKLSAAIRDLRGCLRAASDGGDCQSIEIVAYDPADGSDPWGVERKLTAVEQSVIAEALAY